MGRILIQAVALLLLVLLLSLKLHIAPVNIFLANDNMNADLLTIDCGPAPEDYKLKTDGSGKYAPVFPGWGNYHYKINTSSDSSQLYFNQGLNLYYGYHYIEAFASFKEAARHDPDCVMAWWGQALALGPNINVNPYRMPLEVLEVTKKLSELSETALSKEKEMTHLMCTRYSEDTSASARIVLNRKYSEDMRLLMKKYPGDHDIAALFAESIMLQHPWDLWNADGTPRQWTPELVQACEDILKVNPRHPAAAHYYIHAVEASRTPQRALKSADLLQEIMPGVGHMVHMSSHIYIRTGLFQKGIIVNEKSRMNLNSYYSLFPSTQRIHRKYTTHALHMEANCALNAGMLTQGLEIAQRCRLSVDTALLNLPSPFSNYAQYQFMTPFIALVRFGQWQKILDEPVISKELRYASLWDHFGRGMAHINLGNISAARDELEIVRTLMKKPELDVRTMPLYNRPAYTARVGEKILEGEILFRENKVEEAISAFREAVSLEDAMVYFEPKEWPIPARQYLGKYLLKLNRAAEAEKVYRKDLELNQNTGWSYFGLYKSLEKQHKMQEAKLNKKKYQDAFAKADVQLDASAF